MKINLLALMIISLILVGCTTFHGIEPIYPKVGNPISPKGVNSLQPTFRWKPSPEPDVTYDIIIYECIKLKSFWRGIERSVGREVYYRQGLKEAEHKINEPLKPDSEYYWSIRTRQGEKVSKWATYDYVDRLSCLDCLRYWNLLFIFETP